MPSTDSTGPVPIPWWRFLLMTALGTCLYFAVWFTVSPARTHPAFLIPTIFLGGVLGVLVAKWEATSKRGRRELRRAHRRRSASEARWYMFGLAGGGLVLAQLLPATALEWLALGLTALTTGAAAHAWMTARRHEQETRSK